MRLWRLCKTQYASTTLSGIGGLYAGGRWHRQGTRIVYTSSSPSLAALEFLVHISPLAAPKTLTMSEIDAPDSLRVTYVEASALQDDWRSYPGPSSLQEFGSNWVTRKRTALMRVPSAVNTVDVDVEANYLIDPEHPDAGQITVVRQLPYSFDPRLFPLPR
jgi:RES domain-containing protein